MVWIYEGWFCSWRSFHQLYLVRGLNLNIKMNNLIQKQFDHRNVHNACIIWFMQASVLRMATWVVASHCQSNGGKLIGQLYSQYSQLNADVRKPWRSTALTKWVTRINIAWPNAHQSRCWGCQKCSDLFFFFYCLVIMKLCMLQVYIGDRYRSDPFNVWPPSLPHHPQ